MRVTIMKMYFLAIVLVSISAGLAAGQPAAAFKSYDEAMKAGAAARGKPDNALADSAFREAVMLAKTDEAKADALSALGGILEKEKRTTTVRVNKFKTETKSAGRYDEAIVVYRQALELTGIGDERRAALLMLVGDIYADEYKNKDLPRTAGKPHAETARAEYSKVLTLAAVSPDAKIRALTARARAYDTRIVFGSIKEQNVKAAADDYKAAVAVPGGSDELKAVALFDVAKLARTINDAGSFVGAYEQVTKLPKALPAQRIEAHSELALVYLNNLKVAEARTALAGGRSVKNASAADQARLYRIAALANLVEAQIAGEDPSVVTSKGYKSARAELDRAVKGPKLTDAEKIALLIESGDYFLNIRIGGAVQLALSEYEKALRHPGVTEKTGAIAQYGIGESYRTAGKAAEATEAYQKVSQANGQYYSYAQQRIKALESPQK